MSEVEKVLVFREAILWETIPGFDGILVGQPAQEAADKILQPDNLFYRSRPQAEIDPSIKQVIPYTVIRNKGRILSYQRTKKAGENRLHGKKSIGWGGHINPCDGDGGIAYEKCFWRELGEELSLERQSHEVLPPVTAVLYESGTEVGRVHFGVVHILDVSDNFVWNPESDSSVDNVEWLDIQDLNVSIETYEAWSQMVIKDALAVPFERFHNLGMNSPDTPPLPDIDVETAVKKLP